MLLIYGIRVASKFVWRDSADAAKLPSLCGTYDFRLVYALFCFQAMAQNLEGVPLHSGENGALDSAGPEDGKPAKDSVRSVQVKSSDGKLHNLFFNQTRNTLTFSIAG